MVHERQSFTHLVVSLRAGSEVLDSTSPRVRTIDQPLWRYLSYTRSITSSCPSVQARGKRSSGVARGYRQCA